MAKQRHQEEQNRNSLQSFRHPKRPNLPKRSSTDQSFSNTTHNSNTAPLDVNTSMADVQPSEISVQASPDASMADDTSKNDAPSHNLQNGKTRDLKSKSTTPKSLPSPPNTRHMTPGTVRPNGANGIRAFAAGSANPTVTGRPPTLPGEGAFHRNGRVDVKMEDREQSTLGPSSQPMALTTTAAPATPTPATTNNASLDPAVNSESKNSRKSEYASLAYASSADGSLEADIPHWDGASVRNSKKSLLGKARRKKLREFHKRNRPVIEEENSILESHVSGHIHGYVSDGDRPYRPSDIVQGSSESSAEEYTGIHKKRHRRRKTAAAVKAKKMIGSYTIPTKEAELEGYRLKGYGDYLVTPREDRKIRRSSHHARSLYKNSVIHPNKKKKKKRINKGQARCGSADGDSTSPASCGGKEGDSDYFEWSDTFKNDRSGKDTFISMILHRGYKLVEEPAPDKKARSTIFTCGNILQTNNDLARPKKQSLETKALNEFYDMMSNNPDSFYGDIKERRKKEKEDSLPIDVDKIPDKKEEVTNVDEEDKEEDDDPNFIHSDSSDDDPTMRLFDRMKRDQSKFYNIRRKPQQKTPDSDSGEEAESMGKEEKSMEESLDWSEKYSKKLNDMFRKHGLRTGRCGRYGQGRLEPIVSGHGTEGEGIGFKLTKEDKEKRRKGLTIRTSSQLKNNSPGKTRSSRTSQSRSLPKSPSKKRNRAACRAPIPKARAELDWECDLKDRVAFLEVEPNQKRTDDNGRRAILIDFAAFFTNAHLRRMEAFKKMIDERTEFSSKIPFKHIIYSKHGDRCDRECIEALMEVNKISKSKEKVTQFLEVLDGAFAKVQKLVLDVKLRNKLRAAAKTARLGIFHNGSSGRMKSELKEAGIDGMIVPEAVVGVKDGDIAPYLESWRELYVHIGVTPSQCLIMVSDRALNPSNSGVIAANSFGARSLICIEGKKSSDFDTKISRADVALVHSNILKGISFMRVLKAPKPNKGPERILVLRQEKSLWNSATELYKSKSDGPSSEVLVRFDDDGQLCWVNSGETRPLSHDGYLKIKDNDFCDLFDPEDVDTLTFTGNYSKRRKVGPIVTLD